MTAGSADVPAVPTLVLMVGLPGSGKTTRARRIAAELGALRLTPDEWMLPLFGTATPDEPFAESPAGRIAGAPGEAEDPRGPRPSGRRDVLEGRLVTVALRALDLGTSAVIDFGLWGRDERFALHAIARERGARAITDYADVDAAAQRQRVADRNAAQPEAYEPLSDDELDLWRGLFETPDADELAGITPAAPPAAWASWAEWAEWRWPSLAVDAPA